MITALAVRWLFTAVFAAAGLCASLPRREPARSVQPAGWVSAAFCGAMCVAVIVMTWRSEPAAATALQAVLFGCAALWLLLAGLIGFGGVRMPGLPVLLQTLMAGAMIWMLTAMPAATAMPGAAAASGARMPMPRAGTPGPMLAAGILLAVSCAAACIPWLARSIGPGPRLKDPASAGQAAMSAGMAAMLFVTL